MGNCFGSGGGGGGQQLKERDGGGNSNSGNTTVLFFPDPGLQCRFFKSPQGCRKSAQDCSYVHGETNLSKLVDILNNAKSSLDVCVFSITADPLSNAIIEAHTKRGIKVRVISDNSQQGANGSDIEKFKAAGISVRMIGGKQQQQAAGGGGGGYPPLMHHKFAVIDQEILLNGSFNWTMQASLNNRENLVITRDRQIARQFLSEFDKLWTSSV